MDTLSVSKVKRGDSFVGYYLSVRGEDNEVTTALFDIGKEAELLASIVNNLGIDTKEVRRAIEIKEHDTVIVEAG